MDFKQLRALLIVAETGSVTRAAELLNLVQPAVSRQLRMLEEDVGVVLFRRGRQGMELTGDGRTLVEYARRALDQLDRARAELKPDDGLLGGIVSVGLLPSVCDLLSSRLVKAVSQEQPGIRIRIVMGYAGHLQQWLSSGEVDLALLYDPATSPDLMVRPLLEESLWVVGLKDSGLDSQTPVHIADLANHPLILPGASHGLRSLVEHACAAQSVRLNVVAETNSMTVQKSLVLGGHGWTILPSIAIVDDVESGKLAAAPFSEPPLQRKIVLATPAKLTKTAPTTCVEAALVACMKHSVQHGDWPATRWLDGQDNPIASSC